MTTNPSTPHTLESGVPQESVTGPYPAVASGTQEDEHVLAVDIVVKYPAHSFEEAAQRLYDLMKLIEAHGYQGGFKAKKDGQPEWRLEAQ